MPAKKGTVTGASLEKTPRKRKGGITGSKHFDTPTPEQQADTNARERLKERFSDTVQSVSQTAKTVADTVGVVRDGVQQVANGVKQVQKAFTGSSPAITNEPNAVLEQAKQVGEAYGVKLIDLATEMAGDAYTPSATLPQMDAKEANRTQFIVQKQNNALDVRLAIVKQRRKIATVHKEELSLIGDLADVRAAGFDAAKKFVRSEISRVDLGTEQSKLEEHEELQEQQIIKTQGVISLTEGIRTEWALKLEKQTRGNERLQIEIQGAVNDNQRRREELEAFMFDALSP